MLRSAKIWDCQSIHLVPVLGDRKIMVAITELDMIIVKWVAPRGVGKTTLIVKFVDETVKTDKFTSTLGPSPYVFSSVQAICVGFRQSSCRH